MRMQRGESWLVSEGVGSVSCCDGLIVGLRVGVSFMVVCLHCGVGWKAIVGLVLIELEEDE